MLLSLPALATSHDLSVDDEDAIILDDDSEEMTLIVRQKTTPALSPSSRTIKAAEFQGKFTDLPAVLETVSGIGIRSTGGRGQYAESAIRGGAAAGLRVYLDGVLLNSASGGAVDLSKIPLDRIQEIRVTKSTSGLRQMGAGMGGVVELFTDADANTNHNITGINFEIGNYGYINGGAILRRPINPKINHQFNIDITKSNNDYPFTHDNGTTIPTIRDPDPTWDDTLMRKKNNQYKSMDAAYSFSIDISENHKITQQLSAGMFEQGLFVYHYKEDQSGLTSGETFMYGADYHGEMTSRLTVGSEASWVYRHNAMSDPDGRYSLGGAGRELESHGYSADFLVDARYAFTENFYFTGLAGTRFERYTRQDKALSDIPEMSRYEYRVGTEAGFKIEPAKSAALNSSLRLLYKYEVDTSTAGFGYWSSNAQKYILSYPAAEAVVRADFRPFILQFSAAASKRSPTFFERFGWSGGFLSNPNLKEETRMEADIGASVDLGIFSSAISVFAGRVEDKIKSIPQRNFVRVMNFADTDFYGAEFDVNVKMSRMITIELSASYLNSTIVSAADPSWIGKAEPFVPNFSGFLKTEFDIWKIHIGHGIKHESECYLSVENIAKKEPQTELSAWAAYRVATFLTLRYRVDNYLNNANFDFLDNPMPRRTHVLAASFNF